MLGLWLRTSVAVCGRGRRPSRIDGTAPKVESNTVVAFGNQVEIDASRAKFGNRSASMLPSGRRRSSAGNSSNTTNTTGGRRSAEWASSSVPGSVQPARMAAATTSSAASQQRHSAARLHFEHLDGVAALAERILRNHDGVALDLLATQVEASPKRGDSAIHGNRDVTLDPRPRATDAPGDLTRDHPARAPDAPERPRQ